MAKKKLRALLTPLSVYLHFLMASSGLFRKHFTWYTLSERLKFAVFNIDKNDEAHRQFENKECEVFKRAVLLDYKRLLKAFFSVSRSSFLIRKSFILPLLKTCWKSVSFTCSSFRQSQSNYWSCKQKSLLFNDW